jgi:hypothetical protein
MELGSYFLFLQEQIKDIIIIDGTQFEEQRQLHKPQKHKDTVPDSALRMEMNALEAQADNAKASDLH